jgi:fumarate hydratase subunit beta
MKAYNLQNIQEWSHEIKAGDCICLGGYIYTARDAAHKKICDAIRNNEPLPFELKGATIYYAGPTGTPPGSVIGSVGPTTSSRMDKFTPTLLNLGLAAMIGKGDRSDDVVSSIAENRALYFCAVGGAGAYIADCVKSCEVIAYSELGCESVKKLYVEDFAVFCGIDTHGKSIFDR